MAPADPALPGRWGVNRADWEGEAALLHYQTTHIPGGHPAPPARPTPVCRGPG